MDSIFIKKYEKWLNHLIYHRGTKPQSLEARAKLSDSTCLVCQEEGQLKQTLGIYSVMTFSVYIYLL